MGLQAFHARAEVRDAALQRLAAHADAGRLAEGALLWNGAQGSVAGCLAETADAARWEDRLGLPRWLAYALDLLAAGAPARVEELLRGVAPGSDLARRGSRLICEVLDAMPLARVPGGALDEARGVVAALHRRLLRGGEADAAQWRAARRCAVRATDAAAPLPAGGQPQAPGAAWLRAAGGVVEAAAWDPLRSATAVAEVLRQRLLLHAMEADEDFGWTPEDDAQVRRLLGEMHAAHLAGRPQEQRTVFDFLEIEHAAVAARLRERNRHARAHALRGADQARALLGRVLRPAE
ncbi:hypothetical protein [Xylophilus sp.]|uniref:hypothetical protein n=1 Tax=Xylophilus sp. TaxID=2653893 RepID=UPI0013B6A995|nr:hypothetical protein [Xylophilus sp.]KAF1043730.1 MAG: hypothetical protein GAK38_03839 [Xylophilus sp.]